MSKNNLKLLCIPQWNVKSNNNLKINPHHKVKVNKLNKNFKVNQILKV